jgi:hypothetical protein
MIKLLLLQLFSFCSQIHEHQRFTVRFFSISLESFPHISAVRSHDNFLHPTLDRLSLLFRVCGITTTETPRKLAGLRDRSRATVSGCATDARSSDARMPLTY